MRAVVAVTVLALALRLAGLGGQSLWLDEVYTANLVEGSLGQALRGVLDTESTPPLYYVLLWLWTQVAGTGDVALRLPSALLGTAAVPLLWAAARRLGAGEGAALAAALLLAVNPFAVWFGQEARAYALLLCLTALTLWAWAAAREDPRPGPLARWALAAALLCTAHWFGVLLALGTAALLLRAHGVRRVTVLATGAVGATVLALAPIALAQRGTGQYEALGASSLLRRVLETPKHLAVGYDGPLEVLLAAVTLLGLLVLLGFALRRHRTGGALELLVLAAALVALPLLAAVAGFDVWSSRNLLVVLPLLLVGCGAGAAVLGRERGAAVVAAVALAQLVVVVAVAAESRWQRDDWKGAIRAAATLTPAPHILAIDPNQSLPAKRYRPELQGVAPSGFLLSDLVLVELRAKRGEGPPAPPPAPPEPGLQLVDQRVGTQYRVSLFRAPQPRQLYPGNLNGGPKANGEARRAILLDPG